MPSQLTKREVTVTISGQETEEFQVQGTDFYE